MRMIGILTWPSLALLAWDGVLHSVTLVVGRVPETCWGPAIDLPWLLFPTFPSWAAYDAFWAAVHVGAFVVLGLALRQKVRLARAPGQIVTD